MKMTKKIGKKISAREFCDLDADAQVAALIKLSKSDILEIVTGVYSIVSTDLHRAKKALAEAQIESDRTMKRTGEIEDEMNRVLNENERLRKIITLLNNRRSTFAESVLLLFEVQRLDVELAQLGVVET
jgi:uncharacterized phage infection (PIP) family protein YhgE